MEENNNVEDNNVEEPMVLESLEKIQSQQNFEVIQEVDWDSFQIDDVRPLESFAEDGIVALDTPHIDSDWSSHFNVDTEFESIEQLHKWITETGRNVHMALVVYKSDFSKGRNPRIIYGCERSGSYDSRKGSKSLESITKRKTGTKKCGCPFSIKETRPRKGEDCWVIEVVNGRHNHKLAPYIEGHAYPSRLTPSEKQLFIDLSKGGVKPKVALGIIKEKFPENSSSLQTLYNVKKKNRKEEMDCRTELQQLLMLADQESYVVSDRRDSETDEVRNLFFASSDSISLAKCFPQLFIMDATYKTTDYDWALFEIVGITSTMKTFSVCFCFMEHETTENFQWALEKFKELLYEDQVPLTIVTDRDLALIKAIEVIFPTSVHLLCRWHIRCGIERKGKNVLPKDGEDKGSKLKSKWCQMWDEVVFSSTEAEYECRLYSLQQEWLEWPELYEYAESWLPYKEKFIAAWTNLAFHLGNTSSNRVEGAHGTLKDNLRNSHNSFLTMYQHIHTNLKIQLSEIKKSFTMSMNYHQHDHGLLLFKDIRGSVSSTCLKLLRAEYDRAMSGIGSPDLCGCSLNRTHGLPCSCKLSTFILGNTSLSLDDVHPFWRKLSVLPRRMEIDDLEYHEEFVHWVKKYREGDANMKKWMLRRLKDITRPQTTWLTPPNQPAKPKGRPSQKVSNKKRKHDSSTKRDPSAFEREVPYIPFAPSGLHYSLGNSASKACKEKPFKAAPKDNSRDFNRYSSYVPEGWLPFIEDIEDVRGDGNCGYRAVAKCLGMPDDDGWETFRKDLVKEIEIFFDLYATQFGGADIAMQLKKRCTYEESPSPPPHWMLMGNTGYVIANNYGVVLIFFSGRTVLSFVPQHGIPPPQEQAKPSKYPVICFMHVAEYAHYVTVRLKPFPPIPQLTHFCTQFGGTCAAQWVQLLTTRISAYKRIFAYKFVNNDQVGVWRVLDSDEEKDDKP